MSHFDLRNSAQRILTAAGVACLLAAATTGSAQAANYVGWAFDQQPDATAPFTPPSYVSYNSAGGSITIARISTGVYEVEFGGLYGGGPDNIQVSTYNYYSENYCMSEDWYPSGTTVVAYVQCFAANGNPADTTFTLLYQARTSGFGSLTLPPRFNPG